LGTSSFAHTIKRTWGFHSYWRSLPFSLFVGAITGRNGLTLVDGTSPVFYRGGRIAIGRRVVVRGRQTRSELGAVKNGELVIGDYVYINQGCSIVSHCRISIGNNSRIGDFTSIMDTSYHDLAPGKSTRTGAVEICENVWIGRNCIVLPGIRIGENSVVAAGSIVTKDVAPNLLVAGNPAQEIQTLPIQSGWVRH
jgi:acetyltransferase-like isoleucine patch superfamily enzyme